MGRDLWSLILMEGKSNCSEVYKVFLRACNRKTPAETTCASLLPAVALGKHCSAQGCGGSPGKIADVVNEQAHQITRAPLELLFVTPALLQNETASEWKIVSTSVYVYCKTSFVLYGHVYHIPHHFKVSSCKKQLEIMVPAQRRKFLNFERVSDRVLWISIYEW